MGTTTVRGWSPFWEWGGVGICRYIWREIAVSFPLIPLSSVIIYLPIFRHHDSWKWTGQYALWDLDFGTKSFRSWYIISGFPSLFHSLLQGCHCFMTSSPFSEVRYPNLRVALGSLPSLLLLLSTSSPSPPSVFLGVPSSGHFLLTLTAHQKLLPWSMIWDSPIWARLPTPSDLDRTDSGPLAQLVILPYPRFLWIYVLKVTTVAISSLGQTILFSISYFGPSALTSTQNVLRPFLFDHYSLYGNSQLDSVTSSKMSIGGLWVTESAFKSKALKIDIAF